MWQLSAYSYNLEGKKSDDWTHPDYVPSLFAHTSDKARVTGLNAVKRHQQKSDRSKRINEQKRARTELNVRSSPLTTIRVYQYMSTDLALRHVFVCFLGESYV